MLKKTGNLRTAGTVGLMVASTLWIGNALGWFPDGRQAALKARLSVANSLALPVSQHVQRQRFSELDALLKAFVSEHPEFQSAGWRTPSGRLLSEAGRHSEHWSPDPTRAVDLQNLNIDIHRGTQRLGGLELHLAPLPQTTAWYAYTVFPGPMIYAVALCSSLACWFVLGRVERRQRRRTDSNCVNSAFDALKEPVFLIDRRGLIVLHNRAFEELTGEVDWSLRDPSQLKWLNTSGQLHGDRLPWQAVLADSSARQEVVVGLENSAGKTRLLRLNAVPVQIEKNQAQGVMVSCEDITIAELQRMEMGRVLAELRKSEAEIKVKNHELEFLAAHDPLTQCGNRRSFYETYQRGVAEESCLPYSLILCDIDFFKRFNDQYGHGRGDAVLRHIGAILRSFAPNATHVFRMGGEEFCVLLPNCQAPSAMEIAEVMREAIAETKLDELAITASFGVMTLFSVDPSPDSLLENADRALYESKRAGRNRVTHYDQLCDVQDKSQSCSLVNVPSGANTTMPLGAISALMKTLAYREPSTASHSMRVANLCVLVANRLLPKAEIHLLEAAALLHDIGKIGIPDAILLKPDKLTPQEWAIMDEHDVYSREIIKAALGSADLVRIVENHHAFFGESRKGLPMGRAIPLGARILAICDAYDSMVSDRVYRKGCSPSEAMAELRRCAPRQFDPDIVEVFAAAIEQSVRSSADLGSVLSIDSATATSIADSLLESLNQQLLALDSALADNDFAAIRQLSTQMAQQWKERPEVGDLQQDFDRLHQGLADEQADWLDIQDQAEEIVEHCRAAQDTLLTHDFCNRVERSLHRLMRPQSQHH